MIVKLIFYGTNTPAKVPDGGLEPIFNTAPAVSKNTAQFKSSGQNQPKNNHLESLI